MNATASLKRPLPQPRNFSQPFWDAAKQRKLVAQYDPEARKFQFFPRPVSVYTGKRNLEWRELSGKGTVYTYTVTRRGPPAFHGQEPYVIATVELDEGIRIMANLVRVDPERVEIGMKVRVAWEDLDDKFTFFVFEPDR